MFLVHPGQICKQTETNECVSLSKVKNVMRALNMEFTEKTQNLIKSLEVPDEYVQKFPEKV